MRTALVHFMRYPATDMPTSPMDHPATNGDEARVIVVDDAVDVAEAMACALTADGYKVWVAHDGNEALEMVAAHDPHCVLFDIDMPGLDGSELSKRLRDAHGDDLILVAVTGEIIRADAPSLRAPESTL
jgi:CheY-like chemotaxis protein